MQLIFFLILFLSLFFLSRALTETLSLFFLHITRSHSLAVHLLALLFLPGVIIHELSHWLVASILFVPTGEIEFLPRVQGNSVKLGSVQIAKTDPFRRFAIGIAPVLIGLTVLLVIFWYIAPTFVPLTVKTWIFLYILFEIANTMFSSSKDLEGVLGFGILAFLIFALLFFLKVPLLLYAQNFSEEPFTQSLSQTLNEFCLLTTGINVVIIGSLTILMKLFRHSH